MFVQGDVVRCIVSSGTMLLTKGKLYVVIRYEPEYHDVQSGGAGFTWPAYVNVINDDDSECAYHVYRFERV